MDTIKVARDYWLSSQSNLLIPNREYGSRKLIHVGLSRNASSPSLLNPATPARREQQAAAANMRSGKQWVHPPDSLLQGYIAYTAKFLGECAVEQAKGTEVVKDAIRKMKFNKHIKRAEGQKPPKVELTISADGVTIIEPKTKRVMHSHPLHRISYCADDKSDKRMFSFIAKSSDSNQHHCYVFDSEKCAEEITLTVGQAFDLAYRRFLETSGKEMDYKKQYLALQKQFQTLQYENEQLKKRISELEKLKDRTDLAEYMKSNQISSLQLVPPNEGESSTDDGFKFEGSEARPQATVGRRLENLILNTDAMPSPGQTNGTMGSHGLQSPLSSGQAAPLLSPPPPSTRAARTVGVARRVTSPPAPTQVSGQAVAGPSDPFGSPGGAASSFDDPFGMGSFAPNMSATSSMATDQDFMDIQAGFSRGLSIGTDDFSLDDLDPLNQKS